MSETCRHRKLVKHYHEAVTRDHPSLALPVEGEGTEPSNRGVGPLLTTDEWRRNLFQSSWIGSLPSAGRVGEGGFAESASSSVNVSSIASTTARMSSSNS
jgi:hypothetical protein